jgi:hypothetical protein
MTTVKEALFFWSLKGLVKYCRSSTAVLSYQADAVFLSSLTLKTKNLEEVISCHHFLDNYFSDWDYLCPIQLAENYACRPSGGVFMESFEWGN